MATIRAATDERVFSIQKWLGLNQSRDGKTRLKNGEASEMVNFRVTQDGVLKKRPGMRAVLSFSGDIYGTWHGYVNGVKHTVVHAGYGLYDVDLTENTADDIGFVGNAPMEFFGFSGKLYILGGGEYKVWDGETLQDVVDNAYIPVVISECPPAGGGTELEGINVLSDWRRVWYSPDGTSTRFTLPENARQVIVKNLVTGDVMESGYGFGEYDKTVYFTEAPAKGTDTLEIAYRSLHDADYLAVTEMRFAELYNGGNDNRVFLYGDGSNKAIYSGINEFGQPDPSYFPALNVLSIGEENVPITQMIRHYSRLLVFKEDSAYSIYYGQLSDDQGRLIPAFYWNQVNKAIGNCAPGQVQLVDNSPLTLFQNSIYQWRNSGGYSSNLTIDERQARRISDRVWQSLENMDLQDAYCFDDNERKEWYCICGSRAVVWQYGSDVWYIYENFPIQHMVTVGGRLYGGRGMDLVEITDNARTDLGEPINASWKSGYMAWGADYRRKYSAMLWVALEPAVRGAVQVTIETDRKADYTKKAVAKNRATFSQANFAAWSFNTSRRPSVTRLKIKAKKYTYYRLILSNSGVGEYEGTTCTVTAADIRVRYTGYVR